MREKDIVYEIGRAWVARTKTAYVVYVAGVAHSVSDSAYALTEDGLSIAKARANWLARREVQRAAG